LATSPKKKKSSVIVLPVDLLDSEAFQSLNGTAIRVLLRFLRKRRLEKVKAKPGRQDGYVVTNNAEIEYSYAEAKKVDGLYQQRFRLALKTLVDRGFISVEVKGGWLRRIAKYRVHVPDSSEPWRNWKEKKS